MIFLPDVWNWTIDKKTWKAKREAFELLHSKGSEGDEDGGIETPVIEGQLKSKEDILEAVTATTAATAATAATEPTAASAAVSASATSGSEEESKPALEPKKMKVDELRLELKRRGLSDQGLKVKRSSLLIFI